jgi:hypothetical protein
MITFRRLCRISPVLPCGKTRRGHRFRCSRPQGGKGTTAEPQSAEQQYESEQRQFRAGTSTLFLVQQRQTDMITAQSAERRAEADLSETIASFELATGTVCRHITWSCSNVFYKTFFLTANRHPS